MRLLTPPQKKLSSRQISAAAENIAAAQFAMCGFDVLEQGVRARYFYDLCVANSCGMMKVTVHGSFRGFWNLVDPTLQRTARTAAEYHRAIDRWLDRQGTRVAYCLVQFDATDLKQMPRIYLASAAEVAARLHTSVDQLGDTALYEQYEIEDPSGRHTVEQLPERWRFSQDRIAELMGAPEAKPFDYGFSAADACVPGPAITPAFESQPMMN
jgi:hypothetical protein